MNYWLFKSEPGTWGWDDQVKRGAKGEPWDGVRNHQANNNMKAMKVGDQGFFYHSVNEKQIVGIVKIIKEHHPDPTDPKGIFGMVRVEAVEPFKTPITLADMKADPKLQDMWLIRQSRLSVTPISAAEWRHICKRGGVKA